MKYDFDFYDVQCEDGSRYARGWDYWTAVNEAKEASQKTGLWHEVQGVKVLERFHVEAQVVEAVRCDCGHSWTEHVQTANGAFACRHFGCGCNNVVRP
jgi:hypothetical protein